jgi:hypothetical protein
MYSARVVNEAVPIEAREVVAKNNVWKGGSRSSSAAYLSCPGRLSSCQDRISMLKHGFSHV